jgi:hypothetical protein
MLVHNEFHGFEHTEDGLCNATTMVDGRCWYNSVTLSASTDGGRTFRHAATPPTNLVAASDHTSATQLLDLNLMVASDHDFGNPIP